MRVNMIKLDCMKFSMKGKRLEFKEKQVRNNLETPLTQALLQSRFRWEMLGQPRLVMGRVSLTEDVFSIQSFV